MVSVMLCAIGIASHVQAPLAKTELVPSTIGIQPGKPFQLALHMKMAPGWHSYYANPGESGMATKITWKLPPGFKAGPIRWPIPKRIVVGGVAGYVYENEVWLVTDITPPATFWETGRPPIIQARAKWLLCREVCVPQHSDLTFVVEQTSSSTPNPDFALAQNSESLNGSELKLSATISGKIASLLLDTELVKPELVQFFPGDPTYFGAEIPSIKHDGNGLNIAVPLSAYAPKAPSRVTGLLVIPKPAGNGNQSYWIDVQVTKR